MGKNYMPELAKMLGLELGEEFYIKGCEYSPYVINQDGIFDCTGDDVSSILAYLLTEEDEIIKKPWKPDRNKSYFFITKEMLGGFGLEGVGENFWVNDLTDCTRYKIGNCFKTKEEITPEVVEKYKRFFESDEQIKI